MELTVSGRLRRSAQISAAQPAARTKAAATTRQQSRMDRLALSQQALKQLEERSRQERAERARQIEEKKKEAKSEIDAVTKALKVMMKCQKIAARIQAGDKVPPEDAKYLMEHDPEGYKLAMAMRKPKKDPKEWDSVLEDEDREGGGSAAADSACEESGGESAPVE